MLRVNDGEAPEPSRIPEGEFPIRCVRCDCDLTGLGETGRCPQCATAFDRRSRLWEVYGPEAFAEPPITGDETRPAASTYAVLAAVVCMLLLPAVLLAWKAIFGQFDLGFALFAWGVMVVAVVWIVLIRWRISHQAGADEEDPNHSDSG
jgi:hypothetical protein